MFIVNNRVYSTSLVLQIRTGYTKTNMQDVITEFLRQVRELYRTEGSTEHSYRPALKQLLEGLLPGMTALNERKRVEVGAPDYVLFKTPDNPQQVELFRVVSLGYLEAKDIRPGILDTTDNKSQIERYLDLGNVIHTDNLTWRFYFERELVREISIAHIENGAIVDNPDTYEEFTAFLRKVVETPTPTIRTAKSLALHMADRARPIRYTIQRALQADIDSGERTDLLQQYDAFRETLIHDLSVQDFADIYAETIAYGLFAARFNDDTSQDFTLQEAAAKVPQTNPFLRQFFLQIAAYESDPRLNWVLNRFAELFVHTDVKNIMSTYGKTTGMNHDPVTHFYETFLGEYDPKRRKARGVYYTPLPVVQYIVRAVDKVLKEEFGLADGLADDSTITQTFNVAPYKVGKAKDAKVYHTETKEIPRVQILDPATGTSTFLNETVKLIAERKKGIGSGWNDYVEKNLLPRIHGFEILMAAYSMAHMRLGLTLAETGYKPSANAPRLGVYLTNSLEQPAEDEPPLLAMMGMGRILTEEAMAADHVKRDLPIMVVMGNPPYKVGGSNKGKYIQGLMNEYKKDLNEKKTNLEDDYIKFMRYSENLIEKNSSGIVAMVTNNGYLDGITHRQMRKHLLSTFDKIWVYDLHGNTKKKEVAPDGRIDENVFDIMQGVSIIIMSKRSPRTLDTKKNVNFAEVYGTRAYKYDELGHETIFTQIEPAAPGYYLTKKDLSDSEHPFIRISDLFLIKSSAIETAKDAYVIDFSQSDINSKLEYLKDTPLSALQHSEKLSADKILQVKSDVDKLDVTIRTLNYRPFDTRYIMYSENSQGVVWRPRFDVMKHMLVGNNLGLIFSRGFEAGKVFKNIFISDILSQKHTVALKENDYVAPLYQYTTEGSRVSNFDNNQLKSLLSNLEPYRYVDDRTDVGEANNDILLLDARDVLNYIYGVLHSPSYRTKYKEFLKIDFPRVPKPASHQEFVRYSLFGSQLVDLHLMKDVTPGDYPFSGEGEGNVEKISFVADTSGSGGDAPNTTGSVHINQTQYFANVPETAWNFYIGGYQPAQKWLKDRKGRTLGYKDIEHYQRIIYILMETDRLMKALG